MISHNMVNSSSHPFNDKILDESKYLVIPTELDKNFSDAIFLALAFKKLPEQPNALLMNFANPHLRARIRESQPHPKDQEIMYALNPYKVMAKTIEHNSRDIENSGVKVKIYNCVIRENQAQFEIDKTHLIPQNASDYNEEIMLYKKNVKGSLHFEVIILKSLFQEKIVQDQEDLIPPVIDTKSKEKIRIIMKNSSVDRAEKTKSSVKKLEVSKLCKK